jgi:hypothetical protein
VAMAQAKPEREAVKVSVDYLPAAGPFKKDFEETAILESVRTEAMAHFDVRDRQERDTYHYWLHFEGQRISDTNQTLAQLLGKKRHGKFDLVEEITPGSVF